MIISQKVFFDLLRAGLWETFPIHDSQVMANECLLLDWEELFRLAEEQSVLGLVTAGLDRLNISSLPEVKLQFVGATLQIEQQNKAMNAFIEELIRKFTNEGVHSVLVKGQGIAQCYEKPLWRSCGDIDLLLDEENYRKAKFFLIPFSTDVEVENSSNRHIGLTISQWIVELHGSLRPDLGKKIDHYIDGIQNETISNRKVRIWRNGEQDVLLPSVDNDIIFIFSHILQHFYRGGIGLRQICDLARLLWVYRSEVDREQLINRLREMNILKEWKAFAYFMVNCLGMPGDSMPLYSKEAKWKKKSDRILAIIMETGNFGHNKDCGFYDKYPRIISKAISLWIHTKDSMKLLDIFPVHAMLSWWRMVVHGTKWAIK